MKKIHVTYHVVIFDIEEPQKGIFYATVDSQKRHMRSGRVSHHDTRLLVSAVLACLHEVEARPGHPSADVHLPLVTRRYDNGPGGRWLHGLLAVIAEELRKSRRYASVSASIFPDHVLRLTIDVTTRSGIQSGTPCGIRVRESSKLSMKEMEEEVGLIHLTTLLSHRHPDSGDRPDGIPGRDHQAPNPKKKAREQ